MFELCEFYISDFISSMFSCEAIYFAFVSLCFFGVFALTVNLIMGRGGCRR